MNNLLNRTFWHGTTTAALDEIISDGLVPERSTVGYTCLTTSPEAAIYWGRLNAFLKHGDREYPETKAVLIGIPASLITEDNVVPEARSATLSCYGCNLPGRSKDELGPLARDWRSLLEATDCIGFSAPLRITRQMARIVDIPFEEGFEQIMLFTQELTNAACPPQVRDWLDRQSIPLPALDISY